MSDGQMSWQRHGEGTGDPLKHTRAEMHRQSFLHAPAPPFLARLVEDDLERIRQIMREELRQDWNEHLPFGEEMDAEEERKWQEVEQERERRHLEAIAQLVRREVHRALYDSPEHEDDVPSGREMTDEEEAAVHREHPLLYTREIGDRIFADEEEERVEAHIVTVKHSETPRTGTVDFTYEGVRYRGTVYEVQE